MTLKLHVFPPSPRAFKVMAVASYLKLDYEICVVDMTQGMHRSPEFTALNPNQRMPAMEDNGFVKRSRRLARPASSNVTLLTPNIPEAATLLGAAISDDESVLVRYAEQATAHTQTSARIGAKRCAHAAAAASVAMRSWRISMSIAGLPILSPCTSSP
jgi:hypothetical protein